MAVSRVILAVVLVAVAGVGVMFFGSRASAVAAPRDVVVNCGDGHRSVIRTTAGAVGSEVSVECVPIAGLPAAASFAGHGAGAPGAAGLVMVPAVYAAEPQVMPAVERRAPVSRLRAVSAAGTSAPRVAKRSASWQKRALIIGAAAGTGAGVGALAGGKKGALIGAAAAGGGAAVADLIRNR